jgi:transposase
MPYSASIPEPAPPMHHRPRLKPLGTPKSVVVRTDEHGTPIYVRLPGKPARRVAVIRERWRIDDEWWRHTISRDYLTVVLDDGKALTLYHDLLMDAWYVQRG